MTGIRRLWLVLVLVLVLVAVAAGCGEDGDSAGGGEGADLYKVHCASCHGGSGGGGLGPSLEGIADRIPLGEHIKTVEDGRPGGMPKFEGDLTPAQIEAVVNYERTEFK
jgi:mono/diheme cytochrome c family protein